MARGSSYRVNKEQYKHLIALMEKYRLVARSRIGDLGARGNKFAQRKWNGFAKELNKLGPCKKSGAAWKKYWTQCRLNARTKKAKFLKSYGKTGNTKPLEELDPDVERICDIFGAPGLGFAIIPECGFKPRKPKPTRDQMELMCYFFKEDPDFAIELTDEDMWDDLLDQLHSRVGPKFTQDEWKEFWLADVRNLTRELERCGVDGLDDYYTLVHEVRATCQEYINQLNEHNGLDDENDDWNNEGEMEDDSADGSDSDADKGEAKIVCRGKENPVNKTQEEAQPKWDSEINDKGREMNKDSQKKEKLMKLKEARRRERMHPYKKNLEDSSDNTPQQILVREQQNEASNPGNDLVGAFRIQLRTSAVKLKGAVKNEIDKSRIELERLIDEKVRLEIRHSFNKIKLQIDKRGVDTMKKIESMESDLKNAIEETKANLAKAAQQVFSQIAEAAAKKSLALISLDIDELDKTADE
ncbi:hypothetical protein QAD02_015008 [Eretmocerus hayati]|uniref:Uncharacterized protein n=1 Tax=Eretmocerus hayati TaxID=131215 RepID=A0ACC2P715_9HYME|nr:hypothetical protein QAD02_015008 [Eretmocerus hayati]